MLDRFLMGIGILLLVAGIGLYGVLALKGEGNLLIIFALIMSSLLFFNLPTVLARRRDRRRQSQQDTQS